MDKSSAFNQYLNSVFVNYEWTSARSASKYLIITAPTFETGMQQFVTHKISKGFEVDMFNTNVTGTTTTAIKSFIQQRYNNPSTKPEYILLVGDVAQIPAWIGSGEGTPRTDLNYVQLEGADYFADVFIGRFSIANVTELQNAINKSVYMENFIGTLTKKNIYMSSTDNWQITEGTHNYVIDQYFGPAAYTNLKLYTHTYGATTQQLINALNDNQIFAIYSGHGSETSWADGPPLNQSQVNALTNTWYPFVYSFACVTGSYHIAECFGETWLRTDNGASTFYGSSVNSYWDEDDILERRLIKAMFEDGLTRVTPMFDMGKIYLVNHYGGGVTQGSTMLRYLEMYNLMGDPSIPVVEMGPPCPIDPASNPNPPNGATGLPLTGNTVSWTNGTGTTNVELWFGPQGNVVKIYDGPEITQYALPNLNYNIQYQWYVFCKNDTCGTQGPTWTFTTVQDPNLVMDSITVYPQNANYWTGTCNTSTKTQVSLVNAVANDVGWMAFDISAVPNNATINSVTFYGYLYANSWPYWSITPMGSVNPVTGSASAINSQVSNNYQEGTSYSYNQESGTITNGWLSRVLENTATADLQSALGQDWFAIGLVDFDFSSSYYVDFQGWAEANKPFLRITYSYLVPVELASFTAEVMKEGVELNWTTTTETNNQGFQIERMNAGGSFEQVGYVAGFGTTTEPKSYSFIDSKLEAGSYTYRLKQIDFDGTITYSEEVNVEVEIPLVYALEQNYPNPFNPNTTIKYSISEDGFVKLAVYNLLGEAVTTLVNNEQKAGRYEVVFDASRFASGVYLYRLESKNFISIKKMIVIK